MSTTNTTAEHNLALNDEIEAINSIYGDDTITFGSHGAERAILKLPGLPFSFILSFDDSYPNSSPIIDGIASTGNSIKGEGEAAVAILKKVLDRIYNLGQVCLFDLIEEAAPLLTSGHNASEPAGTHRSADRDEERPQLPPTGYEEEGNLTRCEDAAPTGIRSTQGRWAVSEPLSVQKSTFIAHATPCHSRVEAAARIAELISGSKKIASATHNITAYRIRSRVTSSSTAADSAATYIQDCDDDGETAAGGRLLHLLQLMDAEDVVVVVTRWYGGVKLGGERFRCIGNVAREALVIGGWGRDWKDEEGTRQKPRGKTNKK